MNKEVKQLVRSIEGIPGIELRNAGSGHTVVYNRGKYIATIPSTPSDSHWRENTMATLRRAGVTPAVNPKGGRPKRPEDLMTLEQIKERLKELKQSAFARFLAEEMPKLQPGMRTYKTHRSAETSLYKLRTDPKTKLSEWTHVLLDQALREWDKRAHAEGNGAGVAAPAAESEAGSETEKAPPTITDAELDEAIAIDLGEQISEGTGEPMVPIKVPADGTEVELPAEPEPKLDLSGRTLAELGRDHEELTGRVKKLDESISTLSTQRDELVTQREAIGHEILGRL